MVKDCKDEVYISDNPLVMHNQKDFGPYGNIGLAVPGIEIYYPLSPNTILAYMCPLALKKTEEAHAKADKSVAAFFWNAILITARAIKSGLGHSRTGESGDEPRQVILSDDEGRSSSPNGLCQYLLFELASDRIILPICRGA